MRVFAARILFTSILVLTADYAHGEEVGVILGGQSNMSGRGYTTDLPPTGFPQYPDRITNFTNAWTYVTPAVEPLDNSTGQIHATSTDASIKTGPIGVGPGLAFADRVTSLSNLRLVLIPCARGGKFAYEFLPTYLSLLYGSMLQRAEHVQVGGAKTGVVLWWQGESDATTLIDAEQWAERTQIIFNNLRKDLNNPGLVIIYVQLGAGIVHASYPYWEVVRAEQALIQRHDQIMVPAPAGPSGYYEIVHLLTPGQIVLGQAMGDAYLAWRAGQGL